MRFRTGGQTGVDRAALDACLETGTPVGGWCPEGRLAEDGPIPLFYPLEELTGAGYEGRTRANVRDSDATIIIHFGPIEGGTLLTRNFCRELGKPFLLIDGGQVGIDSALSKLERFLAEISPGEVNVAGPRASESHVAYGYTLALMRRTISGAGSLP